LVVAWADTGLNYDSKSEALKGAVYTLREAAKRNELPTWLRSRLTSEANACEKALGQGRHGDT
jgi:hypothetical protein